MAMVDRALRAEELGEPGDALDPFLGCGVETALPLHRLEDEGRRGVDAAGGIVQHHLDLLEGVDVVAERAIVGHPGNPAQRAEDSEPFTGIYE